MSYQDKLDYLSDLVRLYQHEQTKSLLGSCESHYTLRNNLMNEWLEQMKKLFEQSISTPEQH